MNMAHEDLNKDFCEDSFKFEKLQGYRKSDIRKRFSSFVCTFCPVKDDKKEQCLKRLSCTSTSLLVGLTCFWLSKGKINSLEVGWEIIEFNVGDCNEN